MSSAPITGTPPPKLRTEGYIRGGGCQEGWETGDRRFGREVAARKEDNRSKGKNPPAGKVELRTLRPKKGPGQAEEADRSYPVLAFKDLSSVSCFKETEAGEWPGRTS